MRWWSTGRWGAGRLRVTMAGPGGHSWADAGRANPIMALAAALVELGRLRLPSRPRTTLNCGVIRGGTSVNSIPEVATADLDLRSVSGMELDRVELGVLETLTRMVEGENHRRGSGGELKLHVAEDWGSGGGGAGGELGAVQQPAGGGSAPGDCDRGADWIDGRESAAVAGGSGAGDWGGRGGLGNPYAAGGLRSDGERPGAAEGVAAAAGYVRADGGE